MSVIIKGIFGKDMPMPQEGFVDIRIHFKSGKLRYVTMPTGEDPFYATFEVEKLPPHGRLIDADKLLEKAYWDYNEATHDYNNFKVVSKYDIADAPTVIEAEGSEE